MTLLSMENVEYIKNEQKEQKFPDQLFLGLVNPKIDQLCSKVSLKPVR